MSFKDPLNNLNLMLNIKINGKTFSFDTREALNQIRMAGFKTEKKWNFIFTDLKA